MSKLKRAITIVSLTAVATFGVAACGGDKGGGGGGGGAKGGDINVTMTSFPDYVDPQLSYTLEGWEVLWNVYTPLLTYKHAKGDAGTEVVPGLAKDMPEISAGRQDLQAHAAAEHEVLRRHADQGLGLHLRASSGCSRPNSGGSVFYEGIVGATDFADGKADTISGIKTDDNTGDITIAAGRSPTARSTTCSALMFAAPVPPSTPLDKDATNNPPPSSGPFMITKVDAPQTLTMERNPQFKTVKDAGAVEVADAQVDKITVTQNKNNSAQVTGVEQNTIDFMIDPPDADRLAEVKAKFADRFRLEDSINTYYFWMNTQKAPFNDLKVRQAINYAIDPEALNRVFGGRLHPTQQILPPGMPGYEEYKLYPGPDLDKAKQL